jgi:hypothetical protein
MLFSTTKQTAVASAVPRDFMLPGEVVVATPDACASPCESFRQADESYIDQRRSIRMETMAMVHCTEPPAPLNIFTLHRHKSQSTDDQYGPSY